MFGLGSKWDDVLQKCDLDGDGKVDFHEFITAAVRHQKVITRDTILSAFELFDTNRDGFIDIQEFKTALPTRARGVDPLRSRLTTEDSMRTDYSANLIQNT